MWVSSMGSKLSELQTAELSCDFEVNEPASNLVMFGCFLRARRFFAGSTQGLLLTLIMMAFSFFFLFQMINLVKKERLDA